MPDGRRPEDVVDAPTMRSLVITLSLPWPTRSGADLRTWSTICALAELGPVAVFAIQPRGPGAPPLPAIERWLTSTDVSILDDRVHSAKALAWLEDDIGHPSDRWYSTIAERELRALARAFEPDVVVLEHLWTRRYVPEALRSADRVILNLHNVERTMHRRDVDDGLGLQDGQLAQRLVERAALIEEIVLGEVNDVWVPSAPDAELLRDRYGDAVSVAAVPSAVDLESYKLHWPRDPGLLVYSGAFGYPPNAAAARRLVYSILPPVRATHPTAHLTLVGAGLPAALGSAPGVQAPGELPAMLAILGRAAVMPVPLDTGDAVRLKVIEALAAGVPVVSSPKGIERLRLTPEEHVLLADSDEDFVAAISQLLSDQPLRDELAAKGRALVAERYSPAEAKRAIADALVAADVETG